MKIKRIIAFLLLASMLLLACACNSNDTDATDGAPTDAAPTEKEDDNKKNEGTDKPLLETDIWLSDPSAPVRIVYADGAKAAAVRIYDKITALDANFTIGKYNMVKDTVAADGTPEILIGDTNRAASAEAKKLITEDGDFYSIYVSGNSIAIYSADPEGLESAAEDLISKMSKKGSAVIYNNVKGNYAREYQKYTLLEALVKTAKDEDLPVYRISVYDSEGLKTETVNASNPCQNCYSVAKLYCVTAIGMLYDEGKIKTTDTIGSIFADELAAYGIDPTQWNKVTIHDVMRHRAGFDRGGFLDIDSQDSTEWSSQDFLKLVLSEPLVHEPGAKSVYTDGAFYLISRVVTKISGEKLDDFLAARLFKYTDCREFAFSKCPEGYPIGATGIYIRSADVAKLGHIYLNGGKYGDVQIISQEWVDKVIDNGYELHSSGEGYSKGGMRGQNIYINFEKNVAVAWHSYDPNDLTGVLSDTLHSFIGKMD
jgi:hypothetical protein